MGIIGVFGNRRVKSATALLAPLVTSGDSVVSHAAISALGMIGTPSALEALESSNSSVTPSLRNHFLDATLVCAERLFHDGNKEQAVRVYRRLNTPGEPLPVRVAALRGIVAAEPSNAAALISGILRSNDAQLHAAAIQLVKDIRGIEDIRSVARTFPDLSSEGQMQLVARVRPRPVVPFDALFFDGDAKEAVAFAYLGWLSIRGLPGNLPAATGARGPRVLGHITPP